MRVLDIDLDFFLSDCCPLAEMGKRPALIGHEPWPEEKVIDFLEKQCGLSANAPVPGRVFETHDSALLYWREQMQKGKLKAPFHVTHVDAHSDLGIGRPGPGFVLNSVLPRSTDKREDIEKYYDMSKLDEANYLLFALAFRWISSLDNVRNPKSRPDIPEEILLPGRRDGIQLSSFASRLFEGSNGREPEIPFNVFEDYRTFISPAQYDHVTLAISPRYSPEAADALVPVVSRYILA